MAKGLEQRAVIAMACDDDGLALKERIDKAADESELDKGNETERHLFLSGLSSGQRQVSGTWNRTCIRVFCGSG